MRKLLHKLHDRKGISLTEVVIAMAMVVMVSGAAISVLVASIQFDAKYKTQTHVLNACESAAHCIRFADSDEEVIKYLGRLGFVEEIIVVPDTTGTTDTTETTGATETTVATKTEIHYRYPNSVNVDILYKPFDGVRSQWTVLLNDGAGQTNIYDKYIY